MESTMNVNMTEKLNHKQIVSLIVANPDVRFFVSGEPGIGKSALIKMIQEETGYESAYVDVPTLDLGDVAMPVVDHETRTTRYYPNARFKLHLGKPVIIMLDEWTKGMAPVKNMTHPLFEVNNPRLGDVPVPAGTIVFLTGNLESDGVGDSLQAHSKQRLTRVELAKPDSEYWLQNYAIPNRLSAILCAWVDRHPHCLASYTDGDQDGNELIFNPKVPQGAVVSPRTLEKASHIINARDKVDTTSLHAALQGTVGASAASSIMSFIRHHDSLPSYQSIIDNPSTAKVPEDQGAIAVLCYGMLEKVERATLTPIMKYLARVDLEWQSIFCVSLARHKTKQQFAFENGEFANWCATNQDIL
jgi:hypothetical protein